MRNYFLLTMLLVSTSILGAQRAPDPMIEFLIKKCALFSEQQGLRFVGQAAEVFKPAPSFIKTITPTGAVHYAFDGTLPECLMGFLFFKNQEGKIERSKAIRADQRDVRDFTTRMAQLMYENAQVSKQMLFVAPESYRDNPLLLNLLNHLDNNTTIQSHYYSKNIIHPAGSVKSDGNSLICVVEEARETAYIQEKLNAILQDLE